MNVFFTLSRFFILLIFSLFSFQPLFSNSNILPENKMIQIELGFERLSGYTLYEIGWQFKAPSGAIGNYPHSPISRLRFPMDVYLISSSLNLQLSEKQKIGFKAKTNVTKQAGQLEDYDWGYWYLVNNGGAPYKQDSLDIFSYSKTSLTALSLEADYLCGILYTGSFGLKIGAGFLFQYFKYDVSNTLEWYPSYNQYSGALPPQYANAVYINGKVLEYSIYYYVPYLQAEGVYSVGNSFEIALNLKFSPISFATDRDDHILRGKLSKGTSTGFGMMGYLKFSYSFNPSIFISLQGEIVNILTKGTQEQSYYKNTGYGFGSQGTIDCKIETFQYGGAFKIGVNF